MPKTVNIVARFLQSAVMVPELQVSMQSVVCKLEGTDELVSAAEIVSRDNSKSTASCGTPVLTCGQLALDAIAASRTEASAIDWHVSNSALP